MFWPRFPPPSDSRAPASTGETAFGFAGRRTTTGEVAPELHARRGGSLLYSYKSNAHRAVPLLLLLFRIPQLFSLPVAAGAAPPKRGTGRERREPPPAATTGAGTPSSGERKGARELGVPFYAAEGREGKEEEPGEQLGGNVQGGLESATSGAYCERGRKKCRHCNRAMGCSNDPPSPSPSLPCLRGPSGPDGGHHARKKESIVPTVLLPHAFVLLLFFPLPSSDRIVHAPADREGGKGWKGRGEDGAPLHFLQRSANSPFSLPLKKKKLRSALPLPLSSGRSLSLSV